MVKIEILGTGCAKCKSLAKNVEKACRRTDIRAEVIKWIASRRSMNRG